MGDLGAIDEDVPFDNATADALITAANTAATTIEGQVASRNSAKTTAMNDFRGHFSQLFTDNASVGNADCHELADRLREVATGVGKLKAAAKAEQERREKARAWKKHHDNRNVAEKFGDWLSGGDDPPVGPPDPPVAIPVSQPRNGTRQTPNPGKGGGGDSGTSSARPADLRTFATTSTHLNNAIRHKPGHLRHKLTEFQARCKWGSIDCSGVLTGFDKWLAANDEDVKWATLVANAFAAAGGEGNVSTLTNSSLMAVLHNAGVHASRKDIVIDPPVNYGHPPTTGYANDPVNTSTGNFIENEVDLEFGGAAADLSFARCYNSLNSAAGAFGRGWSAITEARIAFDDEAARLTLPDGRQIVFPRLGDGWDRASGENLWLSRAGDHLRAGGNDGRWWEYSPTGELRAFGTGVGNTVHLTHAEGRLLRLEHERGRSLELVWEDQLADDGRPLVVAVLANDSRAVLYTYDERDRLVAATGLEGTRSYRWNDDDLIEAVVDADGVVEAENTYDTHGRVVGQRSQFGRITRFAYLPGRVTVVSDEDGTRSNTWIADERGRLVGVVDADDNRQSTSYDQHSNVVLVTERDGATTVHEYDDRGRRVRTVNPAGADLAWGYDDLDRVTTTVTEAGAITQLGYDGEDRNPARIVDPEGGVTELRWQGGLLREVHDPTGVKVSFGYDRHGDLVAISDALGNTARTERDHLGRVVATVTPSGARTTFRYDDAGHVAERRDPDGAVWRFEHTAAGRLTAVVDPTGARTSVEIGEHGEEERTIDPLGRALTRHLDDLGNLASVELPDGSTWRFSHDGLSRLTSTSDPSGGTWTREYNAVGDLVAALDGTGVQQGFDVDRTQGVVRVDDGLASSSSRFDALGRLTQSAQPDGSAAILTYDRCGRPVESLDPEGGLTLIRRDAAGRPVEVVSPTGATTRYEYDACGRLAATVDPLGARTTIEYDADGRPVRQVLPTGEAAWTEYDACGRVTARFHPGSGIARYAYDAAGRVVASSDTWTGRRRFRFDAAGQLVAVTNGNGGVTRFDYDANGRCVAITDPLGNTTRREFDAMNRCIAETDPLGRTTRAGYDAAGRQVWQEDPQGRRTSWTHDASGRVAAVSVDGTTVSSISRDVLGRRMTVQDHTGPTPSVHELEWNARGQLVRRTRDGRGISWEYDADGRRTGLVAPDGTRTSYAWDAAGRLVAVDHPLLGRAELERDASGRLVGASADGIIQSWAYTDGWVSFHTVTDSGGASRTVVERDEDGRISRVDRDGVVTDYAYDDARQLIESRTATSVARWRYDAAGRLVAESIDGATIEHSYDAGGQLLSTTGPQGRLFYGYDALGRRTRQSDEHGRSRELTWSPTGYLAAVTDHAGDRVRRTTLHADALGELASVDGTAVFCDTAGYAATPVQAGTTPILSLDGLTGVGETWTAAGWRTSRGTGTDPWTVSSAAELPGGLGIGGAGELTVAGLEWMGARAYDPATRGFLTVDPLDPVPGAGWAGNPYSYAGNDPLHALDPLGLRPVTEAELQAYRDSNGLGGFIKKNWEYVAAAGMVIAGGVLIATGVGGPAGMMLISGGVDVAIQKATTGHVNWGEVAVATVAGAAGGVGGTALAARAGMTGLRATVTIAATSGAASGAAGNATVYLTGPGPHTVQGLVTSTTEGAAFGGLTGAAGGAAGHGLTTVTGKVLGRTISADSTVLSGHGGFPVNDGTTVTIPRGARVNFFGQHGDTITDSLGNKIEQQARWPFRQPTVQVARPGDTIPDYYLHPPDGLNITGHPVTVNTPTRLSDLIRQGGGSYDWAACRSPY